jgi:hypothetical protein
MPNVEFRRAAIEPIECFKESWRRLGDQYWLFLGIALVGLLIGGAVPMGILLGAMMCGIDLCYLQRWRGQSVRFETLFRGFDHFSEALIATLVLIGVSLVVTIPMVLVAAVAAAVFLGVGVLSDHPGVAALLPLVFVGGGLLAGVVGAVVRVFFSFTYLLIVDRGLKGLDAVKLSAAAAWQNFGGMLALSLLTAGLSILGMCACYVGAVFVLPVSYGALVCAYDRVFGISSTPVSAPALAPAGNGTPQ